MRRGTQMARRTAMTLIELLVVISIIGVLVALLLPAVQSAREASRRMNCKNNLKQLGLGLLNFESAHRRLPPGFEHIYGGPNDSHDLRANWSWGTYVLPYIEQEAAFSQLGSTKVNLSQVINSNQPKYDAILQTSIPTFLCPSAANAGSINDRRAYNPRGRMLPLSISNYVANNGSSAILYRPPQKSRGVFWANSNLRLSEVTDGTSNTVLLGERAWSRKTNAAHPGYENLTAAGVVFGCRGALQGSARGLSDVLGSGNLRLNYRGGITSSPGDVSSRAFRAYGSNHAGICNFVFVDGSVRSLSEDIEANMGTDEIAKTSRVDSCYEALLASQDGTSLHLNCE